MSSLSEQMEAMPTIEVEVGKSYKYKMIRDGAVFGEYAMCVEELSYDQNGLASVRFRLTEPRTFKCVTTILDR